jgi:type II secretory pathway component PulJ
LEEYLEEQSELEAKDELIAALQDRLAAVQATLTEAKKQKLRDEKNETLDKVRAQLDETCLMLRMSHRRDSSPSCI